MTEKSNKNGYVPATFRAILLAAGMLAAAKPVRAATPWDNCIQEQNVATIYCIVPLFQNIASAIGMFIGVVLFVVIIVSGFTYMTAGGDMKRMEKAKNSLGGALTGIVVVALAYLIIRFISTFTGASGIETFQLNFN